MADISWVAKSWEFFQSNMEQILKNDIKSLIHICITEKLLMRR